ncbi:Putative arrestin-like, immunoglobulin E-set [Septoria linicola]|uniref:Arrestin-like, immunoglobulin E-set n=1 Tax=Septoria linicola TaxID=215465 RepID=A0A9Q9EK67_9PEZI|nr:Putative arrestin-like, immunoglobulin E-set [Septoria linicola]
MVFYDQKSPLSAGSFSKWAESAGLGGSAGGSGMNVRVVLDQPGNVAYTNLDQISGHVMVRSMKSENINSIIVKLEGESRTRLMSPPGPNGERPKPMVEYHKLLYKVQMVFPDAHVAEGRTTSSGKTAYGLPAGEHVYPFSFKIPFNNSCTANGPQQPMIVGMEIARPASRHVKKTLPPTLSGFPGEAEIRYFVKCTVNRHGLLKENARTQIPFNFFPIENPRPALTGSECFARQKHRFDVFPGSPMGGESARDKMKGIFGKKSSTPNSPTVAGGSPFISIDARLPEPAILTCNQDIPLRLIFKKLSDFGDQVFMSTLQISLIGHTKIRAHEVYRTESNSWIICSMSNMNVLLGSPSDEVESEHVIDDALWRGQSHALPNTVAPTFETCNIERTYQLDIRISLTYGDRDAKPQQVVLPLRMDCKVFSGIAPPAEVIARMEEAKAGLPPRKPSRSDTDPMINKLRQEGRMDSDFGSNQIPPTPVEGHGSPWPAASAAGSSTAPQYDDAPPPSYEDAIADRAPPVTAPRPTYAPPAQVEDPLLGGDEKKGFH